MFYKDHRMGFELIRSRRKTVSLTVRDGDIIVRAPLGTTEKDAEAFIKKHEAWIKKKTEEQRAAAAEAEKTGKLSPEQIQTLAQQAALYIPLRAKYYADLLGVRYNGVTIRCQRTRWGSCSTKKNLNFNCLLMLAPQEAVDAVAAHEVCHLVEMNHSPRFYELLTRICPDYQQWDKWLKDNGKALLARLP